METIIVPGMAKRSKQNPLLNPKDIKPSSKTMTVECLLNPGVFRFDNKTWLLVRVAERPEQAEGWVALPMYNEKGEIEIVEFDKKDPDLDLTDPRVIRHK